MKKKQVKKEYALIVNHTDDKYKEIFVPSFKEMKIIVGGNVGTINLIDGIRFYVNKDDELPSNYPITSILQEKVVGNVIIVSSNYAFIKGVMKMIDDTNKKG